MCTSLIQKMIFGFLKVFSIFYLLEIIVMRFCIAIDAKHFCIASVAPSSKKIGRGSSVTHRNFSNTIDYIEKYWPKM